MTRKKPPPNPDKLHAFRKAKITMKGKPLEVWPGGPYDHSAAPPCAICGGSEFSPVHWA